MTEPWVQKKLKELEERIDKLESLNTKRIPIS